MKSKKAFVCQQCGFESPQWYGKCPNCESWSSLVETVKSSALSPERQIGRKGYAGAITPLQPLTDVRHIEENRLKSGYEEFDRVMGGGIVPGSVTLLAGDPGIGKSTLLLHVLANIGGLYVSGEESAEQIKLRAQRLGISGETISVLAETNIERIAELITEQFTAGSSEELASNASRGKSTEMPKIKSTSTDHKQLSKNTHTPLIIIDSIQTLTSQQLEGMAGAVGQIRYCAEVLISLAKAYHIPILIIGHVTKEGSIAGPKVLEHMVDAVLYFEGERFTTARILRTLKNRFGAIEEVGIFDMRETGLAEVSNPSKLFLHERVSDAPGSVVTVLLEGTRPILVEIQALVVPSQLAIPRRITSGVDLNRLQVILAVLQKRLNTPVGTSDVFVNVSGGIKATEPAVDLAIASALLSSFHNKPVSRDAVVYGEVGLLGEIRTVTQMERRAKEAERLGFKTVISPQKARSVKDIIKLL